MSGLLSCKNTVFLALRLPCLTIRVCRKIIMSMTAGHLVIKIHVCRFVLIRRVCVCVCVCVCVDDIISLTRITGTVHEDQFIHSFVHSFHCHVQNATIPCRSQEHLPFLSVMYFFLPPFSTNYSSILSHLILPLISWSTSYSCYS